MSSEPFRIKGWYVLAGLIAFFGIIIAVNVTFITFAARSFPGESVERPYEKGLRYNLTLQQRQQAEAGNWQANITISNSSLLVIHITNENGPVDGLEVNIHLVWPGLPDRDRRLTLLASGPGTYQVTLDEFERLKGRKLLIIGNAIWPSTDWAFAFEGHL